MFPSFPQSGQYQANAFGPDAVSWSKLIDYVGGTAPIYIWWIPTAIGTPAGTGYGQRITYDGSSNPIAIEWAVVATGQGANPAAPYADRATLTYQ